MSTFTHAPRNMTEQRRARIFDRDHGRCQKCTRKLRVGDDWDVDHRIPLACGGTDDDDNLQVLCGWCHDDKTPDDIKNAAKAKRLFTKSKVPGRFKNRKGWR